MKRELKIIDFIEENVNGRTLFTEELVYKLEDGALEGVYSDQISFSNLKYSQSGFQLGFWKKCSSRGSG